jgi:predicted Zn-ribbon and HTH transcriptional regulator
MTINASIEPNDIGLIAEGHVRSLERAHNMYLKLNGRNLKKCGHVSQKGIVSMKDRRLSCKMSWISEWSDT